MKSKTVAWIWIAFYIIVALLVFRSDERFADLITYVSIFIFILIVERVIKIPPASVWLFGAGTLPHIVGVFPFEIDGKIVSFYYLYANYDALCHFVGFCFFCIGFLILYYSNRTNPSKFDIALVLFALVGAGALIEVSEYIGYRLFGFGEGYLRFGDGDNSANFGPWGDSMTDTISNILGIVSGFTIYIFSKYMLKKARKGGNDMQAVQKS